MFYSRVGVLRLVNGRDVIFGFRLNGCLLISRDHFSNSLRRHVWSLCLFLELCILLEGIGVLSETMTRIRLRRSVAIEEYSFRMRGGRIVRR